MSEITLSIRKVAIIAYSMEPFFRTYPPDPGWGPVNGPSGYLDYTDGRSKGVVRNGRVPWGTFVHNVILRAQKRRESDTRAPTDVYSSVVGGPRPVDVRRAEEQARGPWTGATGPSRGATLALNTRAISLP